MCGILAIFGLSESSETWRSKVLQMSKLIRHRGPDWNGIYCGKNCILAHERLAIVGLISGAQPIKDKSGEIIMTVNAEIYNYKELKKHLISIDSKYENEFITDSDCEVLIHLYKEYGVDFLKKVQVNGMYAFSIYDSVKDIYIVARDPIGIIPLYMGWGKDGSIWFSSEMKAIQESCDNYELFTPGHYYVGNSLNESHNGKMEQFYTERWFTDIDYIPRGVYNPEEFRNNMIASVRRHLMSEVPYGVLLSGGLDSSIVASIAAREYKKLGNLDVMRSFCIGLEGSPDIAAAEKVAKFIGTKHYSFIYTIQEGLDAISEVVYHLETFDVTTIRASTPMYLMARKIKATGVKMVLSGEGSDEVFAGYLYFHKAPNKEELHKETVRKVKDLHKFDNNRANKSMMAWGVEARVPFLDRVFLEYSMNLDPQSKMSTNRIEKHLIRHAFDDKEEPYLPDEILWRQKEQFSDGVGYNWIDTLKEIAEDKVSDLQMKYASSRFPIAPPQTKEEYMYREIFSKHFPSPAAAKTVPTGKSIACSTPIAIEWDKSFQSMADPSGRAILGVHVDAYEEVEV